MNLMQIKGDGIEELYNTSNDVTSIEIEKYYNEYLLYIGVEGEDDGFDEWMEENYPKVPIERVFVEEIYV